MLTKGKRSTRARRAVRYKGKGWRARHRANTAVCKGTSRGGQECSCLLVLAVVDASAATGECLGGLLWAVMLCRYKTKWQKGFTKGACWQVVRGVRLVGQLEKGVTRIGANKLVALGVVMWLPVVSGAGLGSQASWVDCPWDAAPFIGAVWSMADIKKCGSTTCGLAQNLGTEGITPQG